MTLEYTDLMGKSILFELTEIKEKFFFTKNLFGWQNISALDVHLIKSEVHEVLAEDLVKSEWVHIAYKSGLLQRAVIKMTNIEKLIADIEGDWVGYHEIILALPELDIHNIKGNPEYRHYGSTDDTVLYSFKIDTDDMGSTLEIGWEHDKHENLSDLNWDIERAIFAYEQGH